MPSKRRQDPYPSLHPCMYVYMLGYMIALLYIHVMRMYTQANKEAYNGSLKHDAHTTAHTRKSIRTRIQNQSKIVCLFVCVCVLVCVYVCVSVCVFVCVR